MSTAQLEDDILAYVQQRNSVTFIELCRDVAGFADPTAGLMHVNNLVMWEGIAHDAAHALQALLRDGRLDVTPCGPLPYLIDGATLRLPLATTPRAYARPHWMPMTFSAP